MSEPPLDVLVMGAGPAGLSAALWCADLGLTCLVVERSAAPGGQLHDVPHPMHNLPGLPGADARGFAESLVAQVRAAGVEVRCGAQARLHPHEREVDLDGRVLRPGAVVIATGVRRRRLHVPGEDALLGTSVRFNVGGDLERYRDLRAVVVGGGDDALVHAAQLAPFARGVTVLHRRDQLRARAALAAQVRADARITLVPGAVVTSFEGERSLRAVHASTSGGDRRFEADVAFVCAGPVPNGEGFGVARAPDGAILVDRLQRTSRAGVFAVGDVCCSEAPTVSTALGHGAVAAKTISAMRDGTLREDDPAQDRDVLRVRGLRLPARIGAYAREVGVEQTLRFDLTFTIDARAAALVDRVERTLDYAAAAEVIRDVLSRRHHHLVETVAHGVATELLARFGVAEVSVEVTKSDVPQEGSEAAVIVRRARTLRT